MTKHYYTGVSAYFEQNDETHFRLRALATALSALQPQVGTVPGESYETLQNTVASADFRALKDHQALLSPEIGMLPHGTPTYFHSIDLGIDEMDNIEVVALHIPVVSQNRTELHFIVETVLRNVLFGLFGKNLIQMETKFGTQDSDFDKLHINQLYR